MKSKFNFTWLNDIVKATRAAYWLWSDRYFQDHFVSIIHYHSTKNAARIKRDSANKS